MLRKICLILIASIATQIAFAQTLYNVNVIQKIEIQFSVADWDFRMDTAKAGQEGYLMADWVKVNGIQYDSVGVKYKGNSSYDSTQAKNPLHIRFDKYKNQNHEGFDDIKLSNGYGDPSMIREVLAYNILANYMHCPRSNFAQVYINGNYVGIFSSAEDINKKFIADHFYSNQGTIVKCNPTVSVGPTTKSNFRYLGVDSTYTILITKSNQTTE
jgi:spore coat protein CotH